MNQGLIYEHKNSEIYLILLFDVQKEVLFDRMHKRGLKKLIVVAESKPEDIRSDDKPEIMEKRITTFLSESMKAFDFYNKLGKVRTVDAMTDPDSVEN